MTAQELINDALRLVGVLNTGEGPNSDEHTECLRALNTMIESWNTERLIVYAIARDTYTLTPAQPSYTIGTGGELNAPRPVRIENAGVIPAGQSYEHPLHLMQKDEFAAIRLKGAESTFPTAMYDDRAYPLASLHFWPVPSNPSTQLVLYTWRQLSAVAALGDTVAFPPGYAEAILYNLALRLAPRYREAMVSPLVIDQARESKAGIKRINLPAPLMSCEDVMGANRGWNRLTGSWGR
jgi:hypothetical protein